MNETMEKGRAESKISSVHLATEGQANERKSTTTHERTQACARAPTLRAITDWTLSQSDLSLSISHQSSLVIIHLLILDCLLPRSLPTIGQPW